MGTGAIRHHLVASLISLWVIPSPLSDACMLKFLTFEILSVRYLVGFNK